MLLNSKYGSYYQIFTDGSKDSSGNGVGFFDSEVKKCVKFHVVNKTSIMHCELIAISEALSYIETIAQHNFVILSDSKSDLQHLARISSRFRGYPIAYKILDSIWKLQESYKHVILQWIPSHIGIVGNDEADMGARQSTSEGILITSSSLYNDILIDHKSKCIKKWKEYFDERARFKGIWYKTIQCQPLRYPWFEEKNLSRKSIVTLLRLRSGHIPSKQFKYLIGLSNSPNCETCDVVEDVQHVLTECVRNETKRRGVFSTFDVGVVNSILASPLSEEARMLSSLYLYCLDGA